MNIFFSGEAGSGKTYCSNYLINKHGYIPGKLALPVYSMAGHYFGMKNKDRNLLQTIGDVGRNEISKNIFIDRFQEDQYMVEKSYEILYNTKVKFVLDDTRYNNEYEILNEAGWVGIYIDVNPKIREQRLLIRDGDSQKETLNHASEKEFELFKNKLIKLDGNGSLEQMYEKLEETLEHIIKQKNEDNLKKKNK